MAVTDPNPSQPESAPEVFSSLPRRQLFILFASSRLLIYLVAGLALLGVGKSQDFQPPQTIAEWFLRWDARWFLDVARNGYWFTAPGEPTNVVFFPLYPWCVRIASLGGRIDPAIAAYGVSLAGLWIACVLLARLVLREWRDAQLATLAVEFLLFSPVSFFFSTAYSESLFLPLVIGCLAAARERRWWIAGSCGLLAALTRSVGVLLVVPLAWEWLTCTRQATGERTRSWRTLPALMLPAVGFGIYCWMMWWKFGDPLVYFHGQQHWGRHLSWFWEAFAKHSFWNFAPFYQLWFAAALVGAFGLLAAGVLLRMPTVFAILGIAFGLAYVSGSGVEDLPRYFSVVFPIYIAAALVVRRWPTARTPLLALSVALQTLSVILFVNGYWFT
jgi:Gpi18-like mannosyltransferase